MTRFRVTIVICVLAALAALTACTGRTRSTDSTAPVRSSGQSYPGGQSSGADRNPANGELGAPAAAPSQAAKDAPPLQSADMVETATIAVNVSDVDAAADALVLRATKVGGRVDGDTRSSDTKGRHASLVIRVPNLQLTSVLDQAKSLGDELSRTRKGEDMRAVRADIDARVNALRDSIGRLQDFLRNSGSIGDLVRLEAELSRRQAELDSTVAQQRALADQIALATLTVTLTAKPILTPLPPDRSGPLGFASAFGKGWDSLVFAARWVGAVAGYALPYAVLIALVLAAFVGARRLQPRSQAVAVTASDDSATTP